MGLHPGILARNLPLKLAALALAMLVWAVVRVEAPDRQVLPGVPVRVQIDDPQYALAGDPIPPSVEVRFGGPARELFRLALDRPPVVVPIDQVRSNDTVVVFQRDWIRLQGRPGVVVESFQPSSVRLSFEPIETAVVPLAVQFQGTLRDGLAFVERPTPEPALTRVSGPQSRIGRLDSIRLVPVDLSQVEGTGAFEAVVDTTGLRGLVVAPSVALVHVRVDEAVDRVLAGVGVTVEEAGVSRDTEIDPSTLPVVLRGSRMRLDALDVEALRLVVPAEALEGLGPQEERRVRVRLAGVPELVGAALPQDSVTVRRVPRS